MSLNTPLKPKVYITNTCTVFKTSPDSSLEDFTRNVAKNATLNCSARIKLYGYICGNVITLNLFVLALFYERIMKNVFLEVGSGELIILWRHESHVSLAPSKQKY